MSTGCSLEINGGDLTSAHRRVYCPAVRLKENPVLNKAVFPVKLIKPFRSTSVLGVKIYFRTTKPWMLREI